MSNRKHKARKKSTKKGFDFAAVAEGSVFLQDMYDSCQRDTVIQKLKQDIDAACRTGVAADGE